LTINAYASGGFADADDRKAAADTTFEHSELITVIVTGTKMVDHLVMAGSAEQLTAATEVTVAVGKLLHRMPELVLTTRSNVLMAVLRGPWGRTVAVSFKLKPRVVVDVALMPYKTLEKLPLTRAV
jgi:hypothetical protein